MIKITSIKVKAFLNKISKGLEIQSHKPESSFRNSKKEPLLVGIFQSDSHKLAPKILGT